MVRRSIASPGLQGYESFLQSLGSIPKLPACSVLSGDEILLATQAADAYREAARRLGCGERTHLVMDGRSDWSSALAATSNSSLFGDSLLLEISLPTGKPGRAGADVLQQLAEQAAEDQLSGVTLLIHLPALDRQTQQSKWAKTLRSKTHWIDIPGITRAELPAWIESRLQQQGHRTSRAGLEWLCDSVEGNLLAAHQEIQKLGLLYPAGELELAQIQSAVLNVARYNLHELRDAMFAGDGSRALVILQGLQDEGEALPLVLWVIGEEIRVLARLANTPAADMNTSMRQLRVFGQRQQVLRRVLAKVPARTWPGALRQVHEIDCLIKGLAVNGRLPDPWSELARLVARIAQAA